ncbi:hypothetical protein LOTGIDRAFT_153900 [Lottia gigantea]|uniref:DNA-directed DNA polymerase n=1 Tax=Lottia gigantea TaxID=225164 RepID=V4ADR1_LOTGI|nr:hypothetical protein LOTGIDRAFT_153900 [Lottia gigantea]ESO91456.1 hypothetical protein LOTGIDRAFT_153900 [Lottia gigantea]
MEVENDKDIIGIKDLDMILEAENPPSTNIVKIPRRLHVHGKIESTSHEFLRTTDFEYVKLYFVLGGKYTSIDVHKSQQEREFIVHLSFAEGSDSIFEVGGFISRAKINIEKEKIKYSYHLNEDHTKKEMSLVRFFLLTSVDIQEIVKADGRISRILDGIVYEENFKTPPYRDYILILRDLRNKYKREGNIVGSNCMKLLGNSLYGKSIQKDIFTTRHLWNEATLQANFDSRVKTYEKINDTQYIVETEIEEKEITTEDSKSIRLTPSHLGSFLLSHSKKIMNNFIHVINGFYKPEIYYTDTDSLYISSNNWKKLNRAGLVSEKDYCKGKNDYGDGGIIFGLYLAPKVKYNIVLTSDGVLKEKKAFKGYSNDKISVEDYVQLAT